MLQGANRHAAGENNRWEFASTPAERPIGRFRIIFGRWHPEPGANGEKRRGQSVNIDDSLDRRLVTFRDAAQGIHAYPLKSGGGPESLMSSTR